MVSRTGLVRFRTPAATAAASDEALIALAIGDREAFGLLYDRYVELIYRYCHGRLGDREAAEDATSLVFTRALAALPDQRGPSVRSWLFVIAHNVVINAWRDDAARSSTSRPLDVAAEMADQGPTPEEMADANERHRSLMHALPHLPEEQRRVVELRLAGLNGPEIAAMLGRSHDSVRTMQRRALARLRQLLGIARDAAEGGDAS